MAQSSEHARSMQKPSVWRHVPLIVILITAVVGFVLFRDALTFDTLRENREALLAMRDQNLALFSLLFVLFYIVIVAFSLPGAAITSVTSGFLFGLALGTVLNVIAATIGASIVFLAARMGLGEMLAARFDASTGRMRRLRDAIRENELSMLFLIRLVPAVPFFVANLLPAMVGVGFGRFVFTTFFGIIPGALVFTSIGVGLGEVFDRGQSPDLSLLWEPHILGPILGLCALAVLPMLIRKARGKTEFDP